jgi:hypothetical protein
LYAQERTLFDFQQDITLYDLTNAYFEGTAQGNANAALGKSKEKRSDCPLVTLALVLDASGFAKRSEIFAGNISEPKTLEQMIGKLASGHTDSAPTVVLDGRIATEENIAWLVQNGYRYLVVSRKRHRQFDPNQGNLIKEEGDLTIRAQRVVNADTGEVELCCHSSPAGGATTGHCMGQRRARGGETRAEETAALGPQSHRTYRQFLESSLPGASRMSAREAAQQRERDLVRLGEALGRALLPGAVGRELTTALDRTAAAGETLQLEFEATPDLLVLPFEAARLPDGRLPALEPGVQVLRRQIGLAHELSGRLSQRELPPPRILRPFTRNDSTTLDAATVLWQGICE